MVSTNQNKIVLNISSNATTSLVINNEAISFKARFDGKSQNIYVPTDAVLTIYTGEKVWAQQHRLLNSQLKYVASVRCLPSIHGKHESNKV
jgi:stringent starvation protein B